MKKSSRILLVLLVVMFLGVGAAMGGACTGTPSSRDNGQKPGVAITGGLRFYTAQSLLAGFDCFEQLSSWFPSYFTSYNSISPNHLDVDMAYAVLGTATFYNVVEPTAGNYTLGVRYSYSEGLFPGITVRPEGISVNGVVITNDMQFPVTGDPRFEDFHYVYITIPLNAGVNTLQMFNVASDGVSRVDTFDITSGGTVTCNAAPSAPSGLGATDVSASQINLSWTASTAPSGCSVGYYNVFRSTTSGFTASSSNQLATGVSGTSYSDTTTVCGTTYYYLTEAVDSFGASGASNQASAATPACGGGGGGGIQINAGGPAVSPFVADVDFSGGATINHANTIDLSGVTNPAPAAVYQTARTGNFTYTIPATSGSSHTIRLHFCETYFSTAGSRVFNVSINGTQVLTNFDIFKTAGAKNKAVIEQFTETANSSGYVIQFTTVTNSGMVSGIEVQ